VEIFRELLIRELLNSSIGSPTDRRKARTDVSRFGAEGQPHALTLAPSQSSAFLQETEIRSAGHDLFHAQGFWIVFATNIIPLDRHRLSHGEYNAILAALPHDSGECSKRRD